MAIRVSVSSELWSEPKSLSRDEAATILQSVIRGHLARGESTVKAERAGKGLLSYSLFLRAKECTATRAAYSNLPCFDAGSMSVFHWAESHLVLKKGEKVFSEQRFKKMGQVREICERSGYQNLVIPRARLSGGWIFEQELPVTTEIKSAIGLYLDHRDQFTGVAREFVGFLCQFSLGDIIGNTDDPYASISAIEIPRYSNIGLYLEEDQGKAGLLDLAEGSPHRCSGEDVRYACERAIRFFPHHFEEILSAAAQFHSEIQQYRGELEKIQREALELFRLIYENHLHFLQKKGITLQNPEKIPEITPLRQEEIKNLVISSLKEQGALQFFLWEGSTEVIAAFLETDFPQIVEQIRGCFSGIIKHYLSNRTPSSNRQLLAIRTLDLDCSVEEEFFERLIKDLSLKLEALNSSKKLKKFEGLARLIIQSILTQFAEKGEVAYYNPLLGKGCRGRERLFI